MTRLLVILTFCVFGFSLSAQVEATPSPTETDKAMAEMQKMMDTMDLQKMLDQGLLKGFSLDGQEIDLNSMMDSLNLDELLEGMDLSKMLEGGGLEGLDMNSEDMQKMMEGIDMGEIAKMMEGIDMTEMMKMLEGVDMEEMMKMMEGVDMQEMMKMFEGMDLEQMMPPTQSPPAKAEPGLKKI